ncbi:LLM class flavin-dependent oxidoreductase [Actinoplanes sp. NPDC026619]|uniref:LLM class flavin-dependent oxidoreductase n=1 Tax=Actinoplanes sp. NPDC026619 TaxID=3155798 RepID=UPI0033D7982E
MDLSSQVAAEPLEVYATSPGVVGGRRSDSFGQKVTDVARWADAAGLSGLLIFTDNFSYDPWMLAQYMVERTEAMVPLVALQPNYQHPVTAARLVAAIGRLYGRRVDINLVTGSHAADLRALGDTVDHDARYDRLLAFGQIMLALLDGTAPVTHHGPYYDVSDAVLDPPLPAGLTPRLFAAGQSPPAIHVARALGATTLVNPEPPKHYAGGGKRLHRTGIRIGIIARDDHDAAWEVARRRYPRDAAREQRLHRSRKAAYASSTVHNYTESRRTPTDDTAEAIYWLHPLRVSFEYCAYLVGSYDEVAEALRTYRESGMCTLILSPPQEEDDLHHANEAIRRAEAR